jgi:hypothetical protein
MRYDANEIMQGVTEVLAYGTAVKVEKIWWLFFLILYFLWAKRII